MSKVYNIAIDWLWVKGNEFSRREDQGNLRLFIMEKDKKGNITTVGNVQTEAG